MWRNAIIHYEKSDDDIIFATTMRKLTTLIALLLLLPSINGSPVTSGEAEKVLRDLDREIKLFESYMSWGVIRFYSIKTNLSAMAVGSIPWLEQTMMIAKSYNTFNNDSALHYYSQGIEWATKARLDSLKTEFRVRRATYLSIGGYIHDALDEINDIDTTDLSEGLRSTYYSATRQMYSYISFYYDGHGRNFDKWHNLTVEAQKRLLPTLPPGSDTYMLNLGENYYYCGEYARSAEILTHLVARLEPQNPDYAIACHILSSIAGSRGDMNARIYYLALSAISDIRNATLEVTSIQELGGLLYERGDLDRAHNYLNVAIDNVVQSRASVRMSQTTELLNIVESHHNRQMAQWRILLYVIIVFLFICLFALVVAIWYLKRQLRKVASMKQNLQTANRAKDVYISQFLNLSSIFMDKLKEFCKLTNRKISAGQTDELYKITKSGKFIEEQSREFYKVFDDSFLNLYPDFVKKVNALLRPDEQIVLNDDETLNSDLRILAFMRLGIDDTNRIAHTLNYSVNTIYAYRNKLRNRAINRDTFETDIMAIGTTPQ